MISGLTIHNCTYGLLIANVYAISMSIYDINFIKSTNGITVSNAYNVNISNLTITGSAGKAISIQQLSSATISNILMHDNIGTNGITVDNSNATINGVKVYNNSNTQGDVLSVLYNCKVEAENIEAIGNSGGTGAVLAYGGGLTLKNSLFERSTKKVMTIYGSPFVGVNLTFNHNSGSNGAVIDGSGEFYSCKFYNNSATSNGGVVSSNSGNLVFDSCIFSDNRARNGGALHLFVANLILKNSVLENSVATSEGGAIYTRFGSTFIYSTIFKNNKATGSGAGGGAVYVVQINEYTTTTTTYLFNTTFVGNNATNGAAIYHNNGTIIMDEVRVQDSYSTSGAVYIIPLIFNATSSNFTNNVATSEGGGLYTSSGVVNMVGCNFEHNIAATGGGLYVNEVGSFDFRNGNFSNNEAGDGAGLYVTQTSNFYMQGPSFVAGKATRGGGLSSDYSSVILDDLFCSSNRASGNDVADGGGCIYTVQSNVNTSYGIMSSNSANIGAGMRLNGGNCIFTIRLYIRGDLFF